MKTQNIVALLPMKANSSRVPGKNFKDFCGKPLFKWVLDSLLSLDDIDKIVINTDARTKLAEHGLVESDRILIRDRKAELCGDHVSMNLVIQDDLRHVSSDMYLMTHTTNPLLSADTIRNAIQKYREGVAANTCDSLFTVNKVQARFYTQWCSPVNHDPNNLVPTQDLEPWFEENSNLYIFNQASFLTTNARIGSRPSMLVSPALESSDIDTPDDWDRAVMMTEYLLAKEQRN